MVVGCPKCKTKLKIEEQRIKPEGSRFKCPKCTAILLVKRPPIKEPAPERARVLDEKKIMVAHAGQSIIEKVSSQLKAQGYEILTSRDGVDMMIKTLRELPHMIIVDVALPKIYGFEVCKQLRERDETKNMKMLLISSIYDKTRYRREPLSLYGADDYIDDHLIERDLIKKISSLKGLLKEEPLPEMPRVSPSPVGVTPQPAMPKIAPADDMVEKAKRLVRTILSDIYLYSAPKVEEAIRNNTFPQVFAGDLKEGLKLYEQRIPPEIRKKGDFFKEEMANFINIRKKSLGIV